MKRDQSFYRQRFVKTLGMILAVAHGETLAQVGAREGLSPSRVGQCLGWGVRYAMHRVISPVGVSFDDYKQTDLNLPGELRVNRAFWDEVGRRISAHPDFKFEAI